MCKSDGHNIICKCPPGFLGDHCEGTRYDEMTRESQMFKALVSLTTEAVINLVSLYFHRSELLQQARL